MGKSSKKLTGGTEEIVTYAAETPGEIHVAPTPHDARHTRRGRAQRPETFLNFQNSFGSLEFLPFSNNLRYAELKIEQDLKSLIAVA